MMDILKRIDLVQQFANEYADGSWSIDTEKWNHHVTPELIEEIRQYIVSLQLKLMHEQTMQAKQVIFASESYDMIDRFLRNNLYDDDYESYSEALHEVAIYTAPPDTEAMRKELERIGLQNAKLYDDFNKSQLELERVKGELEQKSKFIEAAFVAHPNLDLDIAAQGVGE